MAARTTPKAVENLLGDNYDGSTDLGQYIATATVLVDQAVIDAAARGAALSVAQWELVERWLAAHFYAVMDPLYMSKSTSGASGSFQRKSENGFSTTDYGRVAIQLDTTGALNALGLRSTAEVLWAGKPRSAQIPIDQRS